MRAKMLTPDASAPRRYSGGPVPGPRPTVVHGRDWYRISNADGDEAEVLIYDEIGWFGVTADDFVRDLRAITASKILLRVNSPGGAVFDGIAIYNALLDHPASVTVKVDGLAASAASFIVQAGDRRIMGRNATLMIHDASGLCVGQAQDMRDMADLLEKVSANIASIYNDRANGGDEKTVAGWREAMRAETWYSADEAVAAGLADEVAPMPMPIPEPAKKDEPEEPAEESEGEPSDRWDLSMFRYAGRDHAPAPKVAPSSEGTGGPDVGQRDVPSFAAQLRAGFVPAPDLEFVESVRSAIKEASNG